jgi:homogentisate 1,2-dioxygenase
MMIARRRRFRHARVQIRRIAMNLQTPSRFEPSAELRQSGLAAGYMSGFGNSFETEALAGALPVGRNSPQKVNYGLYAEQLSGSPFTAPHESNQRSWLYRIRPTVKHSSRYRKVDKGLIRTGHATRATCRSANCAGVRSRSPTRISPSSAGCARSRPPATPRRGPAWRRMCCW